MDDTVLQAPMTTAATCAEALPPPPAGQRRVHAALPDPVTPGQSCAALLADGTRLRFTAPANAVPAAVIQLLVPLETTAVQSGLPAVPPIVPPEVLLTTSPPAVLTTPLTTVLPLPLNAPPTATLHAVPWAVVGARVRHKRIGWFGTIREVLHTGEVRGDKDGGSRFNKTNPAELLPQAPLERVNRPTNCTRRSLS